MKHFFILTITVASFLLLSKCNEPGISSFNKDTLIAEYSGATEIYAGLDKVIKIDSLTFECKEGLNYLHIDTITFSNDTLKWSYSESGIETTGYLLYKIKMSNDTLYGQYIGCESNGKIINDVIQDNIALLWKDNCFNIQFYYLKKSFHQQYFSFLPLEPLKKDYINTLDTITDSLKYWLVNIRFRQKV